MKFNNIEYFIYLFIAASMIFVLLYDLYIERFENKISMWDSDPQLIIIILMLAFYSLIMMKLTVIQNKIKGDNYE